MLVKGLRLTLQIYADLGNLGGRTQFDVVRMSDSSSRLPIRLPKLFPVESLYFRSNNCVSGRTTVFPVELRRMTFERFWHVDASRRRIPRLLTNSGSSAPYIPDGRAYVLPKVREGRFWTNPRGF